MPNIYRLIELKDIRDERGRLTFAQEGDHIPFQPRRIFVVYDVAAGAARAGHAHRKQHQLLMMMSGSCTVIVDDGSQRVDVHLARPTSVLYVPPMLWLDLKNFRDGAVCAVLASDLYDETDYIRNRDEFLRLTAAKRS